MRALCANDAKFFQLILAHTHASAGQSFLAHAENLQVPLGNNIDPKITAQNSNSSIKVI